MIFARITNPKTQQTYTLTENGWQGPVTLLQEALNLECTFSDGHEFLEAGLQAYEKALKIFPNFRGEFLNKNLTSVE